MSVSKLKHGSGPRAVNMTTGDPLLLNLLCLEGLSLVSSGYCVGNNYIYAACTLNWS